MNKMILVTYYDEHRETRMVSHGIDYNTGKIIILSDEPLTYYDYYYDSNIEEYVTTMGE